MLSSMAVFTVLDATAKFAQASMDTFTAVFFRYAVALVLTCLLVVGSGGIGLLRTRHPWMQAARGFFLVASTWLNFIAMKHMSLTTTAAIFFTLPLIICALSALLLGEQVGPRRWFAVAVGFLGVIVIMRPGTQDFHWAMFCSLGASFMGAFYNLTTRKVGELDRAETSLFYVCLFGSLGGVVPLPWHWQMPQGLEWIFVLLMGVSGAVGHLMLIQAHRYAPAATLAPFIYTQIVWMTLASIVVFGQYPDGWTLAGAAIVVASGIYVWHRERMLGRRATEISNAQE